MVEQTTKKDKVNIIETASSPPFIDDCLRNTKADCLLAESEDPNNDPVLPPRLSSPP